MFKLHLKKLNQSLCYPKILLVVPTLTLLLSVNSSAVAENITLGTGEFLPYTSESLKMGGPLSQVVTAAFKNADFQVELVFSPWNRAIKLAESKRVDATFPWSIKTDRQVKFLYSKPLFVFEHRAFTLKNSDINLSMTALKGSINLCRPQGYTVHGLAKELISNGVAIHFLPPDVENCFEMLKVGRVDIVVVDKLEGNKIVPKLFSNLDNVKILDTVIHKYTNHLIISKKHPQATTLIEKFDKGLDQLMDSGEYQQILFEELGL